MLKINFFNLITTRNIEKAFEAIAAFIEAVKKRVNALKRCVNDAFRNNNNKENSDENIIKVIQSEVKAAI